MGKLIYFYGIAAIAGFEIGLFVKSPGPTLAGIATFVFLLAVRAAITTTKD